MNLYKHPARLAFQAPHALIRGNICNTLHNTNLISKVYRIFKATDRYPTRFRVTIQQSQPILATCSRSLWRPSCPCDLADDNLDTLTPPPKQMFHNVRPFPYIDHATHGLIVIDKAHKGRPSPLKRRPDRIFFSKQLSSLRYMLWIATRTLALPNSTCLHRGVPQSNGRSKNSQNFKYLKQSAFLLFQAASCLKWNQSSLTMIQKRAWNKQKKYKTDFPQPA